MEEERAFTIKEIEDILERNRTHDSCLCGHFESCPNCDGSERRANNRVLAILKRECEL